MRDCNFNPDAWVERLESTLPSAGCPKSQYDRAISSSTLSPVQGGIRDCKNLFSRSGGGRRSRHPYAGRDHDLIASCQNWAFGDCRSNPLRTLQGLVLVAAREHDQKLLAPVAPHEIIGTDNPVDAAYNFLQDYIAGQ